MANEVPFFHMQTVAERFVYALSCLDTQIPPSLPQQLGLDFVIVSPSGIQRDASLEEPTEFNFQMHMKSFKPLVGGIAKS